MSCFIASNETVNRVVHALRPDRLVHESDLDELGNRLLRFNVLAYAARYRGERPAFNSFRWSPGFYSPVELFKACRCWLYQCSEGQEFLRADLFREVESASFRLACEIIEESESYRAAPWDCPESVKCLGSEVLELDASETIA